MIKNKKSVSDIFVKKISEKGKNIFHKSEIEHIWIRSGGSESRFSFALNLLKNNNLLIRVAKDFYILNIDSQADLDEYYWKIIDKISKFYTSDGVIIASEKALEYQMMDFSAPQKLILYTKNLSLRIRIFDNREVVFQEITSGERQGRKNIFSLLKKFSYKSENLKNIFLLNKEIAVLEALSLHEKNLGANDMLLHKFLQRNHHKLQKEIFAQVVEYKYIRAINRLRNIAKENNYTELYQITLDIIKKNGAGCFVSI